MATRAQLPPPDPELVELAKALARATVARHFARLSEKERQDAAGGRSRSDS